MLAISSSGGILFGYVLFLSPVEDSAMMRVCLFSVVLALLCLGGPISGEEPKGRKPTLPSKWGKLGLSEEQRQKVRSIRTDYASRIDALRKQIAALEKEEKAELYKVLTDGQKTRLRELQTSEPAGASPTEEKVSTDKKTGKTTDKPRNKP
jgi:hypothetical protein